MLIFWVKGDRVGILKSFELNTLIFLNTLIYTTTLEFLINITVRLLILENFSRGYNLIWEGTFIRFELFASALDLL